MTDFFAKENYIAKNNTILTSFNLSDFVTSEKSVKNAWINIGGYQSWNPGYEIEPEKKQESLKCHLIKGWNSYLVFPESTFKPSKNLVLGQFITYLRWENFYLVFASAGNIDKDLPPLQFIFNRKNNTVCVELCDKGHTWGKNELQAKIEIFTAESYFECKQKLNNLYKFEKIKGLGNNPGGWESWYNHYANINEDLILKDLKALKETHNIISKGNYSSLIFQIDDGWEKALGDWDIRSDRFPDGLKPLVEKIENDNFIPGLWIAPFIIDARSETAQKHPEWLLRDSKNKLVLSGFNPLWGKRGNFYCLDLSNDEVIAHLDKTLNKIINEWGFRYIKLDFLYAGMLYGKYKKNEASYVYYKKALKILTSRKTNDGGKPVYYLGCGLPFEVSLKNLPLSRIGCDTYEHWENKLSKKLNWNGRNSAYLNLKDTLGHALWDKTVFANDPDVIFIRKDNCSLSEAEKKIIACTDLLFGSQVMYSDDPSNSSSEEEINLTNQILDFKNKFKDEEFGLKQIDKDVYEIFSKSEKYKGLINLGKEHKFEIIGE